MTLQNILEVFKEHDSIILVAIIVLMGLIEVTPIKINPWSSLFGWIEDKATRKVRNEISTLIKKYDDNLKSHIDTSVQIINKMDAIEEKLDKHILESVEKDVRDRRVAILDFANACMNKRNHTKEEFDYILHECDLYVQYCEENEIPNSVADESISEIKRIYKEKLRTNTFLKEGS